MPVLTDATKLFVGSNQISKIYKGNELIFPKITSNLDVGLISYYNLDGNTNDSLANNHLNNSSISYSSGFKNQSAIFDIVNNQPRVNGDSNTNLAITHNGFSASCWIKFVNAPQSRAEWIFSRNNNPSNPSPSYRDFDMSRFGSRIYFDIYSLNESVYIETSYPVNAEEHPVNTWIHLVFTYNGNGKPDGMKIYENGVQRNNGFNASNIAHLPPVVGNLTLGNQNFYPIFGNQYSLQGEMDEIGFWNRELNQMEITQLFEGSIYPFTNTVN